MTTTTSTYTHTVQPLDLVAELERTVIQSLTTTFGVDFLLFQDKDGGDVDTIHNARLGIYATKEARKAYEQRDDYNSSKYHKNTNYLNRGKADKAKQQAGELHDPYRGQTMAYHENRQLDHTIAASEIHHDPGRVLAGKDGVELANRESNLNSTYGYINNIKRDHSAEDFINKVVPKKQQQLSQRIQQDRSKLASMPSNTPQERHARRELENEINKNNEKLGALNKVAENKDEFLAADKKARRSYEKELNEYYTSTKFFKNTASAAASTGLRMGLRETIGIILGEMWCEIRNKLPIILEESRQDFTFGRFLKRVGEVLHDAWARVERRFKELISTFCNSSIAGMCSSVVTTLLNIIVTTEKAIVKLMREMWLSITKAIKLLFFNPEHLGLGDLIREVTRLLGIGLATAAGVLLNQQLNTLLLFPLGTELAAFASALATGILTLGLTWALDHSEMMQGIWALLNRFKSKYKKILEHYQEINTELDRYLKELAKVEFNMNPNELTIFADGLEAANDEYARSIVLNAEVKRRNIDLPFEPGSTESVKNWLLNL